MTFYSRRSTILLTILLGQNQPYPGLWPPAEPLRQYEDIKTDYGFPYRYCTCRQYWDRFESLSGKISREFQVRRSVLLTRLNASVDSFLWSEQGQRNRDRILAEANHNEALDKFCFDQIRAAR